MAKTVTMQQIRSLMESMRALADSCEDAVRRMEDAGIQRIDSTNYPSALRGLELTFRFVDGVAGSATTHRARELIAPILREIGEERGREKQAAAIDVSAAEAEVTRRRRKDN